MARQRSCRRGDDDRIARVDAFVGVWEQLCLAGESVGDVAPLEGAAAAQHPAHAFARDVLHRRDRALAAVVGRRDIDIDPLRVHRAARERHVALPADQRADAPAWRVDGFQAGGVAEAPDHALGVGRHDLAVPIQQGAVGPDRDNGVVHRGPAEIGVELVNAAHHAHLVALGCLAQRREIVPGNVDRVGAQERMQPLAQRHVAAGPKAPDPGGIPGNEGFGKDDQACSGFGGFVDRGHRLGERRRAIEEDRRLLNDRDARHGAGLLSDIFVDAERVPFGVLEPRGLFRAEHGDVIDGLEAWQIVVGEHHAARLERADRGGDVHDLEAQGRVRGLGAARFREERDLGSAAAIYEFAARLGADGFEPELLAVEAPGALDIDDRKHATDLRALEHVAAWCGCVHVVSLRVLEPAGKYLRSGQARPILGPKARARHTCFHVVARAYGEAMAAGRIAEQGLKLLNYIPAAAWSLESFASSGLDRLPRLVASEVTTLSICALARGRRTVFSTPNRVFSAGERASFDAHFHEHPLVLYHSKTPGGTTHRISDSLTNSQFRRTPLYADYYRCVGIDHVMALPLYVDRRFLVSFVFNRKRRDFNEAERDALDLLRPQLAALFGQALSQERTRSLLTQLDSLATPDGWSAIELDSERRLVRASEATRERIKACWPHWKGGEGARLPEVVDRWMQERLEAAESLAGTAASGSLTVGRSGKALRVRLVPNPASGGGFLLFVSLAVEADFPASAAGTTLTPREREVLQWAAAGQTNVGICAILDTSPRTVEKHFEHVFEKLGVETRMAAVMRLLAGSPQR